MDAHTPRFGKPSLARKLRIRIQLGWGKLRRQYLILFRPGYVRRSLAQRRGHCNRSGACCRLMYSCAFLKRDGGVGACGVYPVRPEVCSLFPIDERDLRDRDLLMPDHPCGFFFVTDGKPARPPEPARPGFVNLMQYHDR